MEKLSRDELRAKARRLTSDSLSLGTPHIQALRTVRLRDNVRKGWVMFHSSASSPKLHAAAVPFEGATVTKHEGFRWFQRPRELAGEI